MNGGVIVMASGFRVWAFAAFEGAGSRGGTHSHPHKYKYPHPHPHLHIDDFPAPLAYMFCAILKDSAGVPKLDGDSASPVGRLYLG